jgi:hypothetical protein
MGGKEYLVTLMQDRDGRWMGTCNCPAGDPPADEYTGVSMFHPRPCYHLGAVLIYSTRTVKALEAKAQKGVS